MDSSSSILLRFGTETVHEKKNIITLKMQKTVHEEFSTCFSNKRHLRPVYLDTRGTTRLQMLEVPLR